MEFQMEEPIGFGATDYVVIIGSMLLCVVIGVLSGRFKKSGADGESKPKNTVNEYLLADRKMSIWPVAFSVMATVLSANMITGTSGEIFLFGVQFILLIIGFVIGQILCAIWVVPILHNIEYVSIYEYVERRFDKMLRNVFSVTFLLINLIMNAVFLYAPAISFSVVTGWPYWVTVTATGTICTLYCIVGGMKAVIWTDVLQAFLMFFSIILVIVQGVIDGGGIANVWSLTFDGKTDQHFTITESFSTRYSVWSIVIFGISACFYGTISSQAGAQRLLSVKNAQAAQKSMILSIILMAIFSLLVTLLAIVIFAKFTMCDPFQRPQTGIFVPDQLFMYAAGKMLAHIPGFLGVAMAGLISASLSTISSFINSFAAITLEDYLKPYAPRLTSSDHRNLIICKLLTAFYGILSIGLSLIIPHLGGIFRVLMSVIGALSGPFSGILVLGFFFRRANLLACKIALFVSIAFGLWITTGSLIYPSQHDTIKHSVEGCPVENISYFDLLAPVPHFNVTQLESAPALQQNVSNYMPYFESSDEEVFALYRISFIWYTPIGLGVAIICGIVLSFVFSRREDPDIRLLSPLLLNAEEKFKMQQILKGFDRLDFEDHMHLTERITSV